MLCMSVHVSGITTCKWYNVVICYVISNVKMESTKLFLVKFKSTVLLCYLSDNDTVVFAVYLALLC